MEEGRDRPSENSSNDQSSVTTFAAMEEGRDRPSEVPEVCERNRDIVPQWRRAEIDPRRYHSDLKEGLMAKPQWRRAEIDPRSIRVMAIMVVRMAMEEGRDRPWSRFMGNSSRNGGGPEIDPRSELRYLTGLQWVTQVAAMEEGRDRPSEACSVLTGLSRTIKPQWRRAEIDPRSQSRVVR